MTIKGRSFEATYAVLPIRVVAAEPKELSAAVEAAIIADTKRRPPS
jgi:hypothetical protein